MNHSTRSREIVTAAARFKKNPEQWNSRPLAVTDNAFATFQKIQFMNIFRSCFTAISHTVDSCGRIDESPLLSPSSQLTPHASITSPPTPHPSPSASRRQGASSRSMLYAQAKAEIGKNPKSRINNLGNLSGEDFFKEVNALFDLSKDAKAEKADWENELVEAFLQHFEDKTKAFASECAKSDVAGFNTPITTLRRFLRRCMPAPDRTTIKHCDAMVHRLIQTIPEYARPVPKRAFCIWEGKEITQESLDNLAKFMKLHPDYTLTLLTSNPKSAINALAKRSDGNWLMNRLKVKRQDYSGNELVEGAINRENSGPFANYASGSDIARMYALVKKDEKGESGGLYFDVDCKFHAPLPPLFAPFGIQTLWPPGVFCNGLMAAPPGSEILQEAIDTTVKLYDERKKNTWSADIWINKRAGIISPKDEEGPAPKEGKAKKPQGASYSDTLLKDIALYEQVEDAEEWVNYLKQRHEDLHENPRRVLTENTTVTPLYDIMKRDFGYCKDYSNTLNVFAELRGEDNTFELPYHLEWAKPGPGKLKRRASMA